MTTLDRIKKFLVDTSNFPNDTYVRGRFVTKNGIDVSIQQSRNHYCSIEKNRLSPLTYDISESGTVEMWCCPLSEMLSPYGGDGDPFCYVPLEVVAAYIDNLEKSDR